MDAGSPILIRARWQFYQQLGKTAILQSKVLTYADDDDVYIDVEPMMMTVAYA
jgi:hypothetical protein